MKKESFMKSNLGSFVVRLSKGFLDPHVRVTNREDIQRARLLSATLLVLLILISAVVALVLNADPEDINEPTVKGAIGLMGICVVMYAVNKAGYTTISVIGLILPFIAIFIYIPFFSGESPIFLAFMMLPIILFAFFFSMRWMTILSVALLGLLYVLISLQDPSPENLTYWNLRNLWYFLSLALGLILTFMWHSNVLENIRQQDLKRLNAQLHESEARLRALVENSPDYILEVDPEGRLAFINRFTNLFLGKYARDLVIPEFTAQVEQTIAHVFDTGQSSRLEVQTYSPQNTIDWNAVRVGPIMQDGKVTSLTVILTDITEQKETQEKIRQLNEQLEQRVKERTAQLESANKELEAFSYSISHDLRAPLRSISGYAAILVDEYTGSLNDEARRLLAHILNSAQRMGALIDDLLAFSHTSREQLNQRLLSPTAIAKQVYAELREGQPDDRQLEFTVGEMPQVTADAAMLKQVYANLLENAIKYSSKRAVAKIEVGCKVDKETNVFYVKDNGAGFDMKYAEKLFGVFQRLHRDDEFEGTGIGLAIVQRIINKHGGQIWVEAEVDKGATFYFTLGTVTNPFAQALPGVDFV